MHDSLISILKGEPSTKTPSLSILELSEDNDFSPLSSFSDTSSRTNLYYQPESCYTSSPVESPYEFDDESPQTQSDLFSSHLSVIEEGPNPLCISHADPLHHVLDTLTLVNNEVAELETFFCTTKPSLLTQPLPSSFDSCLMEHTMFEKMRQYRRILLDMDEQMGFLNDQEVFHAREVLHALEKRLHFLQKLICQFFSEQRSVISLEVVEIEPEEVYEEVDEDKPQGYDEKPNDCMCVIC